MYINQSLELVINLYLIENQDFILEENSDNKYDKAKNCSIMRWWKEKNNLE